MGFTEVSTEYGGRVLTLETGNMAKQADGAVVCRYGDSVVLATVVSAKERKGTDDFFPLTVDFQEKFYAAGRIPGGFFKREAKPPDIAVLSARLIDRPIRPLFPEDYLCETTVTVTALSLDGVNEPHIMGSIATSAALCISDIPFNGPIATCRVGLIDGKLVTNFNPDQIGSTQLDLLVSGVREGVIMVEGMAREVSEQQLIDAIDYAHEQMQPIFAIQEELRQRVGRPKREYPKLAKDEALKQELKSFLWPLFEKGFAISEKLLRYQALDEAKAAAKEKFGVKDAVLSADVEKNSMVDTYVEELKATYARNLTLTTKHRIDGRGYSDIRNITCQTSLLPRVHGSALFTRGETQVLAVVTLGTKEDEQKIDSMIGQYQKTFLLHYNFPPFSVGEARSVRAPGRREIGHGYLAERALSSVIPDKDAFPYTIRLVSEVLESNGSSSMATVCSGSMALMDAGVPLKKSVAGVAMGLIKEGDEIAVLSDILGDEDHLGDMDFKVCGTEEGVTAFQMDLKIGGITREIMERALAQAREGRLHILSIMRSTIERPRDNISAYAPRIFTIKVKPEKVREVIGTGGKVVRGIIEQTGVKIDIEDDGTVNVASIDEASAKKAIEMINRIVEEAEPGKIYEGKVVRIADFGAFVEIIPGTDGLCHISELDHHRVRRVDDVVKEGDIIRVKCLEVDPSGKIRLSRKAAMAAEGRRSEAPPAESSAAPESVAEESGTFSEPADAPAMPEEGGRRERDGDDSIGNRRDESFGNRSEREDSFRMSREEAYEREERDSHRLDRDRNGYRSGREDSYDRPDRGGSYGNRGGYGGRHDRGPRRFDDRGGGGGGGGGRRFGSDRGRGRDQGGGGRGPRGGGGGGRRFGSDRGRGRDQGGGGRGPRGGGGGYDRY